MNCQKFDHLVSELARGQMMAVEQRGEALAHSDACAGCATRLRDEVMLTRGLQSLATEMESSSASPVLEGKLREAFRAQQVVVPMAERSSRLRYWLAAVAAVLLIVMSVVALRMRTIADSSPRRDIADAVAPSNELAPSRQEDKKLQVGLVDESEYHAVKVNEPVISKRPQRQMQDRTPRTQVANHVTQEIATDFIPLSSMNAASFQDGGQIVRVQLPRSALASFGLPVNMDRYNEKVKADVLLGVDGLAHAIRFVQ